MNLLPNPSLRALLAEAYSPCRHFGRCRQAQWNPQAGHIPRGFVGATAKPEDVELVLVFSEPGHPHDTEQYDPGLDAKSLLTACVRHAGDCFRHGTDLFRRNTRWFIDQLYPDLSFDDQLRHVWLTEGRLCSIDNEIGRTTDRTCARTYLARQIALLPNATIVAFGGKARRYLDGIGVDYLGAYTLAPPGANHRPARPNWEAAIRTIRMRRSLA